MGEGRLDTALDIIHRQNDDYINRQPCVNGLANSNNTGELAQQRKTQEQRTNINKGPEISWLKLFQWKMKNISLLYEKN